MKVLRPEKFGVGVRIMRTGIGLPTRVVDNRELIELGAPFNEADIQKLCGIHSRRWVSAEQATSDLAVLAAKQAMAEQHVDRIVVATVSPDHLSPSCACIVHRKLQLKPIPVHDVTASCSGFLFALDVAMRAVLTGDQAVLAIAADVRSKFLDLSDRSTAALFGDGAGAALLAPGPVGTGLVALATVADGGGAYHVYVPAGGSREPLDARAVSEKRGCIRMEEGPQVYFAAVEGMANMAKHLCDASNLAISDLDLVVPHQPNQRILDRLSKVLGLPQGKLWSNVARLGNMSGASCAVALHEALVSGELRSGSKVLLLAGGAGFTAGAALLIVDDELLRAAAGAA